MSERRRLPNRRGSIRFPIRHDGIVYLVTLSRLEYGRLAKSFWTHSSQSPRSRFTHTTLQSWQASSCSTV
jgi:hypothetical protein